MACRGVHFAITDADLEALQAASDPARAVEYLHEVIEGRWEREAGFVYESDKAWDAINQFLMKRRMIVLRKYPEASKAVLGGRMLVATSSDLVSLVDATEAAEVGRALQRIDEPEFRDLYWNLGSEYDYEKSDEDYDYSYENFRELGAFFLHSAEAGRHIIFSVDQ